MQIDEYLRLGTAQAQLDRSGGSSSQVAAGLLVAASQVAGRSGAPRRRSQVAAVQAAGVARAGSRGCGLAGGRRLGVAAGRWAGAGCGLPPPGTGCWAGARLRGVGRCCCCRAALGTGRLGSCSCLAAGAGDCRAALGSGDWGLAAGSLGPGMRR
jgi:hypothetical protein